MIKIFIPFIKLSFKEYKPYFIALICNALIVSAQTIFAAYTLSFILSCIESKDIHASFIYVTIIVGIELLLFFLVLLSKNILAKRQAIMEEKIDQMLTRKILEIPFSYLEDPKYLELKKNASFSINNMGAIYSLFTSFTTLFSNLISLIGLLVIILSFDYIIPIILFVGAILTILVVMLSMKSQIKFYKDLLPINYKYGYYLDSVITPTKVKELKFYSLYDLLYTNFSNYGTNVSKRFGKYYTKVSLFYSASVILRYIQLAFVYALVGIKTITEKLPISKFSLLAQAALSFTTTVQSIVESLGNFFRNIEYIKPFMEFMAIHTEIKNGSNKLDKILTIEFKNVTFKYPNTDKIILDNVSFKFHESEKISIVGLNGAGKTTIVKLLCRLYSPNEGTILINDIPIEEYEKDSYIKQISAVFQEYKLFAYSIKDNIDPTSSVDVEKICADVGISEKIEKLPHQYDSLIGKYYDDSGVELSGGQLQKIAIARGLAKDSSLLILDEPTSALDPLAEAEIYENFNQLSKDKMAIYISHRMSSSIFCDRILVIDGGIVSDFDTHQNLMLKKNSLYYKLFTTQAKNYKL